MALSGSSTTLQIPAIGCQFYFTWSATQSIEGNSSTVTVVLYSARYSSGGWFTGAKNKNSYSVAGASSGALTANGVPQGSAQGSWIEQSRWTTTVAHNADGTKTGVVISARAYQSSSSTYDETISVTVNLDTIPRATEITAFPGFTITAATPTTMSVTLDRKHAAFTHSASLSIGGTTVASWPSVNWTGTGTLALSAAQRANMLAAIPSTMSSTMTLTVVTKNAAGTIIGSKTKNATCTIAASVKPTISGVAITINTPVGAVSGKARSYAIRNVSTISVDYGYAPGAGSKLADGYVKIGANTVRSIPADAKPTASGAVPIQVYVKDARGQETTYDTTVPVIDYVALSAQAQYIGRPLSGAENRLSVTLKLSVSSLTYGGAVTNGYLVTIKATPVSGGATITSVNETTNPGTASGLVKTYTPAAEHDVTKAYSVTITVKDDFSTVTIAGSLSTAAYPLVVGDIGIGVGKVPESGRVLDVFGEIYDVKNGVSRNLSEAVNDLEASIPRLFSGTVSAGDTASITVTQGARAYLVAVIPQGSTATANHALSIVMVYNASFGQTYAVKSAANVNITVSGYTISIKPTVGSNYRIIEI